jgi:hypothetical protein
MSEVRCDADKCDLRCKGENSCPGKLGCGGDASSCLIECSGRGACKNSIESGATGDTKISCAAGNCPAQITCAGAVCQVSCNDQSCAGGVCCNAETCNLTGVDDICQ